MLAASGNSYSALFRRRHNADSECLFVRWACHFSWRIMAGSGVAGCLHGLPPGCDGQVVLRPVARDFTAWPPRHRHALGAESNIPRDSTRAAAWESAAFWSEAIVRFEGARAVTRVPGHEPDLAVRVTRVAESADA